MKTRRKNCYRGRGLALLLMWITIPGMAWGQAPEEGHEGAPGKIVEKAYTAMQANKLQEAEVLFSEAIRLNPHSKQARFGLGTLYIKSGHYHAAVEIMEPLVTEFPNDYLIMNNLAWLYASSSDLSIRNGARAKELAQQALLVQPQDYHVWSTLSEAHFVSGDYDKALRAAQEAERLSREAKAPPERIEEYVQQVKKARRAATAFSILE